MGRQIDESLTLRVKNSFLDASCPRATDDRKSRSCDPRLDMLLTPTSARHRAERKHDDYLEELAGRLDQLRCECNQCPTSQSSEKQGNRNMVQQPMIESTPKRWADREEFLEDQEGPFHQLCSERGQYPTPQSSKDELRNPNVVQQSTVKSTSERWADQEEYLEEWAGPQCQSSSPTPQYSKDRHENTNMMQQITIKSAPGRWADQEDSADTDDDNRITTLMFRNIPYTYTEEKLKDLLYDNGFDDAYCSLFVPRSRFGKQRFTNRGYAFISFYTPGLANDFWEAFDGYEFEGREKCCEVARADYQNYAWAYGE